MAFRATIKNGVLEFPTPAAAVRFQQWKRDHDGLRIIIEEDKPSRSHSQNAYYWTYLSVIAIETGDNADDLHEFFKRKLLPPVFKTIRGEEIKLPASTTDLSKNDFTEYLDRICALTNVPLPDPIAAGYLPH
jgi:hypothetical protein